MYKIGTCSRKRAQDAIKIIPFDCDWNRIRGLGDRVAVPWGRSPTYAPRIHGELLKLGFIASEVAVSRYLRRLPRPGLQRWATFIRNHFLLRPTGFDPCPKYRQHLGREHFDQVAPVPASECRSPEQGQPMRPAFRLNPLGSGQIADHRQALPQGHGA